MAEYYLMAQLPSLDGMSDHTPLPITEERFSELCHQHLGKKTLVEFEGLTLLPPRDSKASGSALVSGWNKGEEQLRLALAVVRAEKLKKPFDSGNAVLSPTLLQTARTAVEMDSPLEAESFLNDYRLSFLETLRPADAFSEDAVLYYGLKLKLLSRMRQFDTADGRAAYRQMYDAILQTDGWEAFD